VLLLATEGGKSGMKQKQVTFNAKLYSKGRLGFNFPVTKAEELGYKRGEPFHVDLTITNPNGKYRCVPFTSGTEIRKPGVFVNREFGDAIRVTANKSK
jgi:hypothetical protein